MKGNTMTENTNPSTEAPKLTRSEKIVKRAKMLFDRISTDTAEYNDLMNEINNAEALKNLAVGSIIQVKQGRKFADKDTTRVVEATILATQEQADGSVLYKVQIGVGFDADLAVVGAGAIVSVGAVEAE